MFPHYHNSFVGEAAVSGVSLVNSFNTIFIYLFTALATGGAVIVSQYIGGKKEEMAGESASQTLDWCIRAVIFYIRFKAGKWQRFKLI